MGFRRRYFTILAVMTVIAVVARIFFDIPSWITLAVLLIGWPLGGILITIDDDMPGGWSNPDGKSVPEWKMLWWWADIFLVRGSLVVLAVVVENAVAGHFSWKSLVAAVLMAALGWPPFVRGVEKEVAHAS
jgi:hypothetical protein